jgi:hypothetical protein
VTSPPGHFVVHLVLADGRSVYASPSHPTADGRRIGALRPGDPLDGGLVMATHLVPYVGDTWDLLPAGSAHVYWADGILLKSTLDGVSQHLPGIRLWPGRRRSARHAGNQEKVVLPGRQQHPTAPP